MRLLLSEILPLRTTKDLGDYTVAEPLAYRFGQLEWFGLLKLTDTVWFVADHPMEVTDVRVDKVVNDGWERQLQSDDQGRTWTIVVFATAVPDGQEVHARGTGYRNPQTGEVVDNPADVCAVIDGIAGRVSDWSQLRAECSNDGLTVSGSIDGLKSVQAWLHEITGSVGAIWGQNVGRLYPAAVSPDLIWSLESRQVDQLVVLANAEETADKLVVGYDFSSAESRPMHSITVTAKPERFEGKTVELELKWLKKARAAELVASRLLGRLNCQRYQVAFVTNETAIREGHWVKLLSHPQWPFADGDPYVMITSARLSPHSRTTELVGEVMYTTPSITVDNYSLALDDSQAGPLGVEFKNGVLTLTIRDNKLVPLAGAAVALDGSTPKLTNNQGRVQFQTKKGQHTLVIEHPLFESTTIQLPL